MPELPEVERARKLIQETCRGYKIKSVDSVEDKIVYTGGTDHDEFAKEITGRTITGAERKGKTFWMTLSGKGRLPVMHFGMTGMLQLKGKEPTWYRRKPKESVQTWPPRFYKFVLKLEPQPGSVSDEPIELAFLDGRRLGRLRLVPSPVQDHPPVSALGFDPVLSHPSFEEFQDLIAKKKGTVKGTIMDQAFSAGVGNWVADEVLYQARIHPSCPVNHLSAQNVKDLHYQLRAVPLTAVNVNADSKQFPEEWLFRWRWGKGEKRRQGNDKTAKPKKNGKSEVKVEEEGEGMEDVKPAGKSFLALPNGQPATIEFLEVGGRTTAVVSELQKMPEGVEIKPKISKGGKAGLSKKRKADQDSEPPSVPGSSAGSGDEVTTPVKMTARQRAASKAVKYEPRSVEVKQEGDRPVPKVRKSNKSTSRQPNGASRASETRSRGSGSIKGKLENGVPDPHQPAKRQRKGAPTSDGLNGGRGSNKSLAIGSGLVSDLDLDSDSELSELPSD